MVKHIIGVNVKEGLLIVPCTESWNNWRDFFYLCALSDKREGMPLASHVRNLVTMFVFDEFNEWGKAPYEMNLILADSEKEIWIYRC